VREEELRARVMKREAEVAEAMKKREEEIMEAVRRREAELAKAWMKREEEMREEIEEKTRWILEKEATVADREKKLEEFRVRLDKKMAVASAQKGTLVWASPTFIFYVITSLQERERRSRKSRHSWAKSPTSHLHYLRNSKSHYIVILKRP
jgi:hypothetical protein